MSRALTILQSLLYALAAAVIGVIDIQHMSGYLRFCQESREHDQTGRIFGLIATAPFTGHARAHLHYQVEVCS